MNFEEYKQLVIQRLEKLDCEADFPEENWDELYQDIVEFEYDEKEDKDEG